MLPFLLLPLQLFSLSVCGDQAFMRALPERAPPGSVWAIEAWMLRWGLRTVLPRSAPEQPKQEASHSEHPGFPYESYLLKRTARADQFQGGFDVISSRRCPS